MILDTIQQIPMTSILSCLVGTTHNKVIRTPAPGISIAVPIESRLPPIPFREYKVKSIQQGRWSKRHSQKFYWVRVETLGEMKIESAYDWALRQFHGGRQWLISDGEKWGLPDQPRRETKLSSFLRGFRHASRGL